VGGAPDRESSGLAGGCRRHRIVRIDCFARVLDGGVSGCRSASAARCCPARHRQTDALDSVRIARSVLGIDAGELRVPRADGRRNALRILVIAREMITRERTATINALTALVRTEPLGIDARKALTTTQLREIAAWRAQPSDALDVAVTRTEECRLARHAVELGKQ